MKPTEIKNAEARFEGQTEVGEVGWVELADLVTEVIASEVGDIKMHHFEADLWVDDEGQEWFEWEAEVKMMYPN